MSLGGVIGALGIRTVGAHYLGLIGAALAVLALIFAELANLRISASSFASQEIPRDRTQPDRLRPDNARPERTIAQRRAHPHTLPTRPT
jgi:hypothetical protein